MSDQHQPHAALVLDVDGVVSPVHGSTAWGDDVDGYGAGRGGIGNVPVSPRLNTALDDLARRPGVTAAWLTSWSRQLREGMVFPGRNWPVVAHACPDSGPPVFDEGAASRRAGERWRDNRWWKWWALDAWLRERPWIDTVVWCEDHLSRALWDHDNDVDGPRDGALTQGAVAYVELKRRGIHALLISPATDTGLTPGDLARVRDFLDGRLTPEAVTLPRDLHYPSATALRWLADDRQSRVCANCDESVWYLRYHAASAVDCTTCGRTFYGRHDITVELGGAVT
ncbi:MAG: hypothetical protein V9G04_19275 [Nocardioides sp.]